MRYEVISRAKQGLQFPKVISIDTEFTELNLRRARLQGIVVGVSEDLSYILENFRAVIPFIENADVIFGWNMTVDWFMLDKSGFHSPKGKWVDAMLMEHIIDERLDHGLGDFALREYGDDYKNKFWEQYSGYGEAEKEVGYDYEMRDGCYTFRAGRKYLEALKDRWSLVEHVHRLQWALFDTEIRGIKVNQDLMEQTKQDMGGKIAEFLPKLRKEFHDYCKIWELEKWKQEIEKRKTDKGKQQVLCPTFSFTSDKQVSWLVYDALGIEPREKTKKGNPSTSFEALANLRQDRPELVTLVEYKETKAVYSTFVEGMLERVENGRIYPGFFINGTSTGRISHGNPNMGNLPKEGVIRNFFMPDQDRNIIGADYSQLEVVVEANLTEDPQLLKIILEGASKHDITAMGLGIPRDQAKTLNFALQYGAGIRKISKILGVSMESAQDIFHRYWELYAGVKRLKDSTNLELRHDGYVTNLFGRIRHFDKPKNEFEEAKQQRQAYNFKIQGVGADITNRATYLVAEEFQKQGYGRLLFSVHDELVTEVHKDYTEQANNAIVKCMSEPNDYLGLKYRVECKLYGPFDSWRKA